MRLMLFSPPAAPKNLLQKNGHTSDKALVLDTGSYCPTSATNIAANGKVKGGMSLCQGV
jgi:hypothetical protein